MGRPLRGAPTRAIRRSRSKASSNSNACYRAVRRGGHRERSMSASSHAPTVSKLDTTRWAAGWVVAVAACIVATGAAVGDTRPVVAVQPKIVHLKQDASVTVSGIVASSLEVRLIGASRAKGALLPWAKLVRAHSSWRGRLPQPALRGVYPIELRGGPEAGVWRSRYWLL